MKRRILSLAICVVMLASAFTMAACSGSGSEDLLKVVYGNEGSSSLNKTSMTITIYTITDGSTTDEAIKDVEAALSEISEQKYNTKIDLILLPEETYASVMFNKLDSSISAYRQYIALNQTPITYEDKELNKNPELKKNYPDSTWAFVKGNIADKPLINKLFSENSFAVVVNLAAQAGVRYSITNPDVYIESNLIGFYNILEACRNYPVEHLVYASSSSVYGSNKKIPYSTDDKVDNPVSLYAATKKSNELMAHAYSKL